MLKVVTIKTNDHHQQLQLKLYTNLLLRNIHLHLKQFLIKTEFLRQSQKKTMKDIKRMLRWIGKRTYMVNLKWILKKKFLRTLVQLKKDTKISRKIYCRWLLNTGYIKRMIWRYSLEEQSFIMKKWISINYKQYLMK